MLSNWLSSWYQQNEQQQQQRQSQQESSFQHIEQTVGEGEEDWVQVITPSIRQQKPPSDTVAMVPHSVTTIADSNMISDTASTSAAIIATPTTCNAASTNDGNLKGLSRQERRAKARFAVREMKKQARNAAMVTGRNRKGLASSTCLPASPITA
ncbi:hypothetical protein MAM1_0003d00402 [Mucor ambiguus]|uniref:Uncharacterized protein n=1 Tax=Mucor ambiguus TaxID=91626 RepID=A0A0C9M427_9FUNG|nr:hypothetical protein MAM1_0003d00402 [Mucor ambiguus]